MITQAAKPLLRYDFNKDVYFKDFGRNGKDIYRNDKAVRADVQAGRVIVCCELPRKMK